MKKPPDPCENPAFGQTAPLKQIGEVSPNLYFRNIFLPWNVTRPWLADKLQRLQRRSGIFPEIEVPQDAPYHRRLFYKGENLHPFLSYEYGYSLLVKYSKAGDQRLSKVSFHAFQWNRISGYRWWEWFSW